MTFFESIGVPEQGKAGIFCCVIDLDFQLIKSWAPPCTFGSCLKKKIHALHARLSVLLCRGS